MGGPTAFTSTQYRQMKDFYTLQKRKNKVVTKGNIKKHNIHS